MGRNNIHFTNNPDFFDIESSLNRNAQERFGESTWRKEKKRLDLDLHEKDRFKDISNVYLFHSAIDDKHAWDKQNRSSSFQELPAELSIQSSNLLQLGNE